MAKRTLPKFPARLRGGFTLVEVLVVIGIIGILIAILIPVIGKAQQQSRRTACMSNLREIGNMFNMYLVDNKQRVPRMNPTPSIQPPIVDAPGVTEVFEPYTKGATKVFLCPADRVINRPTGSTSTAETYFEQEGSSYTYNPFFNAFATTDERTGINKVWVDAIADIGRRGRLPNEIDIFQDYDPFHDTKGSIHSRNYLYADFHVGPRNSDRGSRF